MTALGLMSNVQNQTPQGFDWSRYGMGPAFGFWGNMQPPAPPPNAADAAQQAAKDAAAKLLQAAQTSAGDGSGYGSGAASAPMQSGPAYGGDWAPPSGSGLLGAGIGTAAGLATGVPGIGLAGGALGTAHDVSRANDKLASLGLPGASYGDAILSNASFDLFGTSLNDQYTNAVNAAYPGFLAAMTPAPPVASAPAAPASTPSIDFFSAINDLSTVGRLGEVLNGPAEGGGAPPGPGASANDSGAPEGSDGRGFEWHKGGPVGSAKKPAREVKGKLLTTEFVMNPKARRAAGDKVLHAMNKGRIPAKKLRALV